jgi:hypothetical protein
VGTGTRSNKHCDVTSQTALDIRHLVTRQRNSVSLIQ